MPNNIDNDMDAYFSGQKLWGDDFSAAKIEEWFSDEADGYYNLTQSGEYSYGYHALNKRHGYSFLPLRRFTHVLGVGSAYGDELAPIINQSELITILEPADGFKSTLVNGVPVHYEKPKPSGIMPFSNNSFELITCFGVLHHLPNVSKVVEEFYRVLKPGGYVLLREPIISMGDWRKARVGLTKRERGIPLNVLRNILRKAGFTVVSERKCMFSLTSRLRYVVSGSVYNNSLIVALDQFLCALPIWSTVYHPHNVFQKLLPSAIFFVLQKPTASDHTT